MKTNEYLLWFVILALAVGFGYSHKKTLDLEREIEHLRGSAEIYPAEEVSGLDDTEAISRLNQETYNLANAVRNLEINQQVIVERHNGLIDIVDVLYRSLGVQVRIVNPSYISPVGGVELSLVLIREKPGILGGTSLF